MAVEVALGSMLTVADLAEVARARARVVVTSECVARIEASRRVVAGILAGDGSRPVYGVSTGFGALAEVHIEPADLRQLQLNLIRSHAAGVGEPYPTDVVRAMLLLRAQTLSQGFSGVRADVVRLLVDMINAGVHPVIPCQGSVGASGDLAPLAHLALVTIGEGFAELNGQVMAGGQALQRAGLEPLSLQAKEGLALVNGTQAMTAQGALAVVDGESLCRAADCAGAMSLEALLGTPLAFDARIFAARPHPGATASAANLRQLTRGSPLVASHIACEKVQDAYSLRCMPQVHGAVRDALAHVRQVLEREMNSATDNPLVFPNGKDPDDAAGLAGDVVSGGNFHGQPVAMALDYATLALVSLPNISDRRVMQLLDPALSCGLPAFLTESGGLQSGFMMAQVTGAALASESKTLAHPASVDTVPTSADREDHVSMGAIAARKLARVVDNARRALAVELICSAQAIDLRSPLQPGSGGLATHGAVREVVSRLTEDRPLGPDIEAVARLLADGSLVAAAERAVGPLQ